MQAGYVAVGYRRTLPTLATTYRFANGDVCLSTTLTTSGYLHLLTVSKNVPFTMLAYYVDYAYEHIHDAMAFGCCRPDAAP